MTLLFFHENITKTNVLTLHILMSLYFYLGLTVCVYKLWSSFRMIFLNVKMSFTVHNIIKRFKEYIKIFLKQTWILSWKSLHGIRNTSRNHCLWTQFTVASTNVKALSCKEKAKSEHDPQAAVSFGPSGAKRKTVLWSDGSKIKNLYGNNGR